MAERVVRYAFFERVIEQIEAVYLSGDVIPHCGMHGSVTGPLGTKIPAGSFESEKSRKNADS